MPYIRVRKTIKPDGADEAAEEFHAAAQEIRELATAIHMVANGLDPAWEGRARDFYFQEYGHVPKQLEGMAEELERMGAAIQDRTVEVHEEVWVPAAMQ